jgi:hypothetical protein
MLISSTGSEGGPCRVYRQRDQFAAGGASGPFSLVVPGRGHLIGSARLCKVVERAGGEIPRIAKSRGEDGSDECGEGKRREARVSYHGR